MAHELLPDNVKTVRDVMLHDVIIVRECALTFFVVVIVIVIQSLSDEVQAMKMMESFDIGWETSAVFLVDFNLIWLEAGFCGLTRGKR